MALPITPPYSPMEVLSVDSIPIGPNWQYEPKWDGFRCLVFRDEEKVDLQSKSGRRMSRYFPELVEAVRQLKPRDFVMDGEIVVPSDGTFSFDALLQRIHPALSRVKKLATETPALLIVFDVLVDADGRSLANRPLSERRPALEFARTAKQMRLSPTTTKPSEARIYPIGSFSVERIRLPQPNVQRGLAPEKIERNLTVKLISI
jgi:ATP-dependent DNA ligase